jgi:hypothetical protein
VRRINGLFMASTPPAADRHDRLHLFNLDLHVSAIADVKDVITRWGHRVTDWTQSGHSWVFGRPHDPVEVVNRGTWEQLDAGMCAAFHRRYRDELAHFDGFIVTHTPAFALLFVPWNKPIIVVNSTRYEQPFTLREADWRWLDQQLVAGARRGQITLVSNNQGDQAYLRERTSLPSEHIPSLCAYTGARYRGRRRQFVLHTRVGQSQLGFPPSLQSRVVRLDEAFRHWGLFGRRPYRWQELYDFRGIIHLPYQISTMSIFEQYTANVPLFFPSKKFLFELHRAHPGQVLSELSFFQVHGVPFHGDGLNRTADPDVVRRWIDLADYYDPENMPHIQYFESFEHLAELLETVDRDEVSERMRAFNQGRQERIVGAWSALLGRVFGTKAAEAWSTG